MDNDPFTNQPVDLSTPACAAILMSIGQATTAKELHKIAREDISPGKDMSEKQRLMLWDAVSRRFSALNAAMLDGKNHPRWD